MKSKLVTQGAFGVLILAALWSAGACKGILKSLGFDDDQPFDEMGVMEFEVTRAELRKAAVDERYNKPFPYVLNIKLNLVEGDKKKTLPVL